ncbi:MAG: hypothetical protein U5M23_10600 [Marinagarivorans sp.]|nr:hypothetical protein [Marinagarivorans sp.]
MNIKTVQRHHKTAQPRAAIAILWVAMVSFTLVAFTSLASADSVHAMPSLKAHQHQKNSAQGYYKPGAPVQLLSPFEYSLKPGDELSLNMELAVPASGKVELTLLTDEDGLSLLSPATLAVEANRRLQVPVTLRAGTMPSLAFLRLHIRYTSSTGNVTTRALSVVFDSRSEPFKAQFKAQLKTQPMPDVIAMPATETIY